MSLVLVEKKRIACGVFDLVSTKPPRRPEHLLPAVMSGFCNLSRVLATTHLLFTKDIKCPPTTARRRGNELINVHLRDATHIDETPYV